MRAHVLALGVIALLCGGCNSIVIDPLAAVQTDDDDPETPIGGVQGTDVIAMRMSQWNPAQNPSSYFQPSVTVETGPDDLVLFIGSHEQSCSQPVLWADPDADPLICAVQTFWQTMLIIPAERVQPGVIDLADPSINGYEAIWMEECSGGSGSGPGIVEGTLEIVSVDAASITVKLHKTNPQSSFHDSSGDYTAPFCP